LKCNAGFVGFDGTENKRTFLALAEIKRVRGIGDDECASQIKSHGRTRFSVAKFNRMFRVKPRGGQSTIMLIKRSGRRQESKGDTQIDRSGYAR